MELTKLRLELEWDDVAHNGVPIPFGVGVLRYAAQWTVICMWHDGSQFCWKRVISDPTASLTDPANFLYYTTFMFRLFCYGQLFKEALLQYREVSISTVVIHSQ